MKLLDLSHTIEENMTVLRSFPKPKIESFSDCEQSMAFYRGVTFEATRVDMVTSMGTYIDSPFHRWPEGRDVAQIRLEEANFWKGNSLSLPSRSRSGERHLFR